MKSSSSFSLFVCPVIDKIISPIWRFFVTASEFGTIEEIIGELEKKWSFGAFSITKPSDLEVKVTWNCKNDCKLESKKRKKV